MKGGDVNEQVVEDTRKSPIDNRANSKNHNPIVLKGIKEVLDAPHPIFIIIYVVIKCKLM